MNIICKNCNQNFKGKFCNHCGQSAETHAMNFHFVWHDIQHGLLHFDKGLLYTGVQLFKRPGHAIREYLEGKRVQLFKPISLIILLATAYGIIYHYFKIDPFQGEFSNEFDQGFNGGKVNENIITFDKINDWIGTHYSWATLILLPFYAIASFFAFWKSGYNYIEHIILNAFIAAQGVLIHFAFFPILYFSNLTKTSETVTLISGVFSIAFLFWTYMQFFNKNSKIKSFFLTALMYFYFMLCILVVTSIGGLGAAFLKKF